MIQKEVIPKQKQPSCTKVQTSKGHGEKSCKKSGNQEMAVMVENFNTNNSGEFCAESLEEATHTNLN